MEGLNGGEKGDIFPIMSLKLMKIAVIGIGNILMMDEGIGIHVIEELKKMRLPENVEVFDCNTDPFLVLECMDGRDKAIIVDAYKGNSKPGTIYKFRVDEFEDESGFDLSLHNMTFMDALKMGRHAFKIPKDIVVIGVEPAVVDVGIDLSDEIKDAMKKIIEVIMEELV